MNGMMGGLGRLKWRPWAYPGCPGKEAVKRV